MYSTKLLIVVCCIAVGQCAGCDFGADENHDADMKGNVDKENSAGGADAGSGNDDQNESPEDDGDSTGAEQLKVGLPVRDKPAQCGATDFEGYPPCQGNGETCDTSEDCEEGGFCLDKVFPGCYCIYDECFSDEDCVSDKVCVCSGSNPIFPILINSCEYAGCVTNDDCATSLCLAAHYVDDCSGDQVFHGWRCATADDECRGNEYCVNEYGENYGCVYLDEKFTCALLEPTHFCDL